jgi:hypothetical protein
LFSELCNANQLKYNQFCALIINTLVKIADFILRVRPKHQHNNKDQQEAQYQCPMKYEGNKTYNQPGECLVCAMKLVMDGQDELRIRVE